MNIKRGLFRLWIVLAIIWIGAVAYNSYAPIAQEFRSAAGVRLGVKTDTLLVPVFCDVARGISGIDYTSIIYIEPKPGDDKVCWYRMSAFRKAYPEDHGLSDVDLYDKLSAESGQPTNIVAPWALISETAWIALLPPAALWLLGALLVWIGAGFRRSPAPPAP